MNKKKEKPTCVFPIKRNGKIYRYMVRTIVNRERFYIGCYETQEKATEAYNKFVASDVYKKISERTYG